MLRKIFKTNFAAAVSKTTSHWTDFMRETDRVLIVRGLVPLFQGGRHISGFVFPGLRALRLSPGYHITGFQP